MAKREVSLVGQPQNPSGFLDILVLLRSGTLADRCCWIGFRNADGADDVPNFPFRLFRLRSVFGDNFISFTCTSVDRGLPDAFPLALDTLDKWIVRRDVLSELPEDVFCLSVDIRVLLRG